MSFLRLALAGAALLYVAVFAIKNMAATELDLVFVKLDSMPLAMIVLASMAVGASVASVTLAWPMLSGRAQKRRDTRRIEELEREVHGLRTLPLSDQEDLERSRAPES